MANYPFNRTIINTRERPLSPDINRAESDADRALRDVLMHIHTPRGAISPDGPGTPPTGFFGEAFKIRPASPASMNLLVKRGIGFLYNVATQADINGIGGLNDLSLWKPAVLNADINPVTLPAAPSLPDSRIDIIEMRVARQVIDPTSRDVLNPSTGVFEPNLVNKTLSWDYDSGFGINNNFPYVNSTTPIALKVGNPAPVPSAPPVSTGYVKLAEILVGGGVTSIDADKIIDSRQMLYPQSILNLATLVRSPAPYSAVFMDSLFAPPGVVASALWVAYAANLDFDVYVFAGTPISTQVPVVQLGGGAGFSLPTLVTVDSTLQTALAGVNANPAIKVAVGQLGWKIPLTVLPGGTVRVPVSVTFQE